MAKRQCKGETKAGKPCGANPLKAGTVIEGTAVSGKWCRQHDQDLPDNARIGGAQPGAGRPRTPRVVDEMRERVEADLERILAPYFEAIDNAVMAATYEGTVIPSDVPDLGARIAAVEKLLDRIYGRPRQVAELTGEDGGAIQLEGELTDPKVREALFDAARAIDASRRRD